MRTSTEFGTTLERCIDEMGMNAVIDMLESICWEKAEHVRCNWQDKELAKCWEKNAKALQRLNVSDCC